MSAKAVKPKTYPRKRSDPLLVGLTTEEKDLIREAAGPTGQSMADWIRCTILPIARRIVRENAG